MNQVHPGGSGIVSGSHSAHGASAASLAKLPTWKGKPAWHAGSDAGSLVILPPGASLSAQQLSLPFSSQKKSVPLGCRLPSS